MRCGRTFRVARTHPAHARSSGSETLSRSRSLVGYTIDTHESEFSEATRRHHHWIDARPVLGTSRDTIRVSRLSGLKEKPRRSGALLTRGLNFSRKPGCSVANLDARSIPNASIPVPNGCASGPVAVRRHVHGPGRYVDGGRLIIAWARYRRSKQCTHGQAANNAGGYLATACDRSLGCNR